MPNRLAIWLGLGVALGAYAVCGAPAASMADEIVLKIVPDGDKDPDEVSIWERGSSTTLGTTQPIIHSLVWRDSDVKREIDVRAEWQDSATDVGLKLYKKHTGLSFEIPIQHRVLEEAKLSEISMRCVNNSATSYRALIDEYYLCRQLYHQAPDDSTQQIRAAKGWFDTAYRLAILDGSPIRWDKQIGAIMQRFEDRAAENPQFGRKLRAIVRAGYVKRLVEEAAAAELRLTEEVARLVRAKQYEEAWLVNRHVQSVFDQLSQKTGQATINSVTAKIFSDNEAAIGSKLGYVIRPPNLN